MTDVMIIKNEFATDPLGIGWSAMATKELRQSEMNEKKYNMVFPLPTAAVNGFSALFGLTSLLKDKAAQTEASHVVRSAAESLIILLSTDRPLPINDVNTQSMIQTLVDDPVAPATLTSVHQAALTTLATQTLSRAEVLQCQKYPVSLGTIQEAMLL